MPIPIKKGETQEEFISRCVAVEINNGINDAKQAAAICYSKWKNRNKDKVNMVCKPKKKKK